MDHFNVISSSLMYHVLWAKHWPLGLSSHDLCNSAQEAKQFLRLEATVEALRVSKYSTTSAIPINHKSYFRWENSSVDWHRLGYFFLKMNTTVQLPKYIAFNPHILCQTNFNEWRLKNFYSPPRNNHDIWWRVNWAQIWCLDMGKFG